jgi:ribonuclease HI
MEFQARSENGTFRGVEDRDLWRCQRGSVYPDGSCQPHVLTELGRAGWAAAMLDDGGECVAVVSGTVPSCIGQTSYASEWCAAAVTAHLAVGEVDGAQDCKGVVEEWSKPLTYRLRPSSIHAGQSRELLAHESASLVKLRWIKGHVEEAAAVSPQAKRDARGNGVADAMANVARASPSAATLAGGTRH